MTTEPIETTAKPTKYYIDFENVHGAGLKGVDQLSVSDEVVIIYSQAAETFHIEHAIDIMKSKARVRFVEADAGTRNAADFQLIVALYADMDDGFDYVIVSGDGGFDAAIKMGDRMGKPSVRRFANIAGDEAEAEKPKSRRSRRSRSGRDSAKEAAPETAAAAEEAASESVAATKTGAPAEASEVAPASETAPAKQQEPEAADQAVDESGNPAADHADEPKTSTSKRRSRRRRRSGSSSDEQPGAQDGAQQAEGAAENPDVAEAGRETAHESDDAVTAGPEADRKAASASNGKDEQGDSRKRAGMTVHKDADGDAAEPADKESDDAKPEAPAEDEARKPKRRTARRRSTSKETDDAYAKAAEAMRLAFGSPALPETAEPNGMAATGTAEPADTAAPESVVKDAAEPKGAAAPEDAAAPESAAPAATAEEPAGTGIDDVTARVKAHLEENGVQLTDGQLSTVVNALEGPDGRQGFYRRIIKIERQQNGRILYHLVRDHYAALVKLIGE